MSRRTNGEGSKKRLDRAWVGAISLQAARQPSTALTGRHTATAHDFDRDKDGHAAGARACPSTSRPARYQLQSPWIGERRPVIQQP